MKSVKAERQTDRPSAGEGVAYSVRYKYSNPDPPNALFRDEYCRVEVEQSSNTPRRNFPLRDGGGRAQKVFPIKCLSGGDATLIEK